MARKTQIAPSNSITTHADDEAPDLWEDVEGSRKHLIRSIDTLLKIEVAASARPDIGEALRRAANAAAKCVEMDAECFAENWRLADEEAMGAGDEGEPTPPRKKLAS